MFYKGGEVISDQFVHFIIIQRYSPIIAMIWFQNKIRYFLGSFPKRGGGSSIPKSRSKNTTQKVIFWAKQNTVFFKWFPPLLIQTEIKGPVSSSHNQIVFCICLWFCILYSVFVKTKKKTNTDTAMLSNQRYLPAWVDQTPCLLFLPCLGFG